MPSSTALLVQMAQLALKGQTVLITGASGGIGSAVARIFHKSGCNVILTGSNADKLSAFVESLPKLDGVKVWGFPADLRQRAEVKELVEKTVNECPPIDILINNAGYALGATVPFWEQDLDNVSSVLDVNVAGLMNITHGVLASHMMKRKPQPCGTIVNLSSITGHQAPPPSSCEASYHTSKAAVEGFSNVLRHELVGTNIRVLVHRPGVTETEFHSRRVEYSDKKTEAMYEGIAPLRAEDIAQGILWQCITPERVSVVLMETLNTPLRSLHVQDRDWEKRNAALARPKKKEAPVQLKDEELPEHAALKEGNVAVITGASLGGIGYSTALKLLIRYKVRVVLVDVDPSALDKTSAELSKLGVAKDNFECVQCDVSSWEAVQALAKTTFDKWGRVDVLMLNAGVGGPSEDFAEGGDLASWRKTLGVNFYGVLHGTQAFVDKMVKQDSPALVVVTGSKQGITQPPGNPAYNVSKSAVKSLTESLAHSLLSTKVTAHLLVPGWTWTKISGGFGAREKPAEAWAPEQVATELLSRLNEFYIICPDGSVDWETDRARMAWNVGDILEKRPALSRWNPAFKDQFEAYLKDELAEE